MKTLLALILLAVMTGCTSIPDRVPLDNPPTLQASPIPERMSAVPPIDGKKMTIAVYGFELHVAGHRESALRRDPHQRRAGC